MNEYEMQDVVAGVDCINEASEFSRCAGLVGKGLEGELTPFTIGEESDPALRDLAIYFAEKCDCPSSPFRILSSHYRGSLKTLIHGMTRAALLGMFEMERKLRQSGVRSVTNSEFVATS